MAIAGSFTYLSSHDGWFLALYQTDGRKKGQRDVVRGCCRVLPLCDEAVWTWWGMALFGLVDAQRPPREGSPCDWPLIFTRPQRHIGTLTPCQCWESRNVECV